MKSTSLLIATKRELPSDAKIISHKLMIRAGLISKSTSGLYLYLPMGLKILQKIEAIIRDEMNKSGAQEVLMPVVQSAKLWQESGRWNKYGKELLRFKDRHDKDFCLGPTNEEVIVDLARQYIRSHKQLPINFYQIQTKFRDEIRPRFGVMRAREFIMKDGYSFHLSTESMQDEFNKMHKTYCRIFERLGLKYYPVLADSGSIGGENSVEFHVLADNGEDKICFSDSSDFIANVEKVALKKPLSVKAPVQQEEKVLTKNKTTIEQISDFLKVAKNICVKVLIIKTKSKFLALALRGDYDINITKVQNLYGDFSFASDDEIKTLGLKKGFIGVKNLNIDLVVDYSASVLSNFVTGANEYDYHLTGVNWNNISFSEEDLRNAVDGDQSPCGKGKLVIKHGIEVGHIFQLDDIYTKPLNAGVIGKNGKQQIMKMGCYGIGISRLIAAIIEQNHDDKGIIFPQIISPFKLIIIPINYNKSHRVKALADDLYNKFINLNIEVLLDDRKERPGVMLTDSELLGIPHRIVISDSHVDNNSVEYKARNQNDKIEIKLNDLFSFIQSKLD
jgi:prolyl-tRNA synthetase